MILLGNQLKYIEKNVDFFVDYKSRLPKYFFPSVANAMQFYAFKIILQKGYTNSVFY